MKDGDTRPFLAHNQKGGVAERTNLALTRGTASKAGVANRPVLVKSGTCDKSHTARLVQVLLDLYDGQVVGIVTLHDHVLNKEKSFRRCK